MSVPLTSASISTPSAPGDMSIASALNDAPSLSADTIRGRAEGENFPVAMRGIPGALRRDLLALYDYARLVDQVGDDATGDRMAMLDELSREVARIPEAEPGNPIVRRMASVVRHHGLSLEALERLIEANRRDQSLRFVSNWEELLDTCTRSANPVGVLVLGILGQANERTIPPSDAVCSALQVVEHCQDVREDFLAGRIYLPAEDMVRFGCQRWDLKNAKVTPALRLTLRLQVERARSLLSQADSLLLELRGFALPLVAGYAAGGLATCDALERHDFDVLSIDIRPRRRDTFRHWLGLCWRAMKARNRQ